MKNSKHKLQLENKRFGFFWLLLKLFISEPDHFKTMRQNTVKNPYTTNDFMGNGHFKK